MTIKIHYNAENDFFWADSAKGSSKVEGTDGYILKNAGFRFNYDYQYRAPTYLPNFVWWTQDPIAATKMRNFADEKALKAIESLKEETKRQFSIHYKEAGDLSYFYAKDVGRQHESILKGTYDEKTRERYGLRNSKDGNAKFEQKYSVPPNTWWTPNQFLAGIFRPFAVGKAAELIDKKNAVIERSFASNSDIEIPFPKGLKPFDYQKAGIEWALSRKGTLLADEQGLGKTIQAIGVCNADTSIQDVLCICPSAVKINWTEEFKKWSTRKAQIALISRVKDIPKPKKGFMRFMVTNFDKFSSAKERGLLTKAFMEMELGMLVIDEGHYLKNPDAKRTRAILGYRDKKPPYAYHDGIATMAKKRVFLTGTPIKNRPVEIWSLLSALEPEIFNNYMAFVYRYCAAFKEEFYNKSLGRTISTLNVSGSSYLRELEDWLRSTIMIRRLKTNVLSQLPPKTRQLILLEADAETQKLLEQEKSRLSEKNKNTLAMIEKAKLTNNDADYIAAASILQNEDEKIAFEEIAALRKEIGLKKAPLVVEHVKSIIDSMSNGVDKVIVFCHHRDVVEAIRFGLSSKTEKVGKSFKQVETDEYKPVIYMGGQSDQKHDDAVKSFQNDPRVKVFIGTSAAYAGITLHAANVVVFAELSFVPADMLQGEDRAHRIGQKKNVTVQHLAYDGSLDAKISQMLVTKMDVIVSALDLHTDVEISKDDVPIGVKEEEIVKKIETTGIKASIEMEMEEQGISAKDKLVFDLVHSAGWFSVRLNNGKYNIDSLVNGQRVTENNLTENVAKKATQAVINTLDKTNVDYVVRIDNLFDAKSSSDKPKKKAPAAIVYTYSDEQKEAAYNGIQYLASVCDGARTKDGMGFSVKTLSAGNILASRPEITDNDMEDAIRVLNIHRTQMDTNTRNILGLWPKGEKPLFTNKQKKTLLTVGKWIVDNIGEKLEPIDLQILAEESERLDSEQDISDKLADSFKNIINTYWNDIDNRYQAVLKSMKLKKGRGRPKKVAGSDETATPVKAISKKTTKKPEGPPGYTEPEVISINDIDWGTELYEENELKQANGKIDHRLTYKLWVAEFEPAVVIKEFNKVTGVRNTETNEIERVGIFYKRSDGEVVSPDKYAYIIPSKGPGLKSLIIIPGIEDIIVKGHVTDHKLAEMFVEQLGKEKAASGSKAKPSSSSKTKPSLTKTTSKSTKYTNSQKQTAKLAIKYLDEYFDALKEENQSTPYTAQWISNVKRMNNTTPDSPSDKQVEAIIKVIKMHKPIFKPMGVFEKLGVKLRTLRG